MRAIRAVADDVAVMKDGKIVELNAAEKIFSAPRQPYTRQLIYAANLGKRYNAKQRQFYKSVRKEKQ